MQLYEINHLVAQDVKMHKRILQAVADVLQLQPLVKTTLS